MGAELAISDSTPGGATLQHFNDEIIAKIHLDDGNWILMGRCTLVNADGDKQYATAKLVHDANVVIDSVRLYIDYLDEVCVYLQRAFVAEGEQTITLECNTYDGATSYGKIIAFKVDAIDFQ